MFLRATIAVLVLCSMGKKAYYIGCPVNRSKFRKAI